MRAHLTCLMIASALVATGCPESRRPATDAGPIGVDGGPGEDGGPIGIDGGPGEDGGGPTPDGGSDAATPDGGPPPPTEGLDLLFLVDNSNSMTEEQASLAAELPRLLEVLASGDADLDGTPDFPPFDSMNVGVITADMGTGGFTVPTCSDPVFGDDGVLRTTGNTAVPGCSSSYPPFLSFGSGDDPTAFAFDVGCVAVAGTGGCGFEQQLEAVLKATTASSTPATGDFDGTFGMGTTGHADGANSGFIRPGAHLGIVMLTDEEDCSALDPEIYNPASFTYSGDLNLRCFNYPAALQPVGRYVDGLLATRAAGTVSLTVVAGIPVEVEGETYADILDHPDMQEMIDPSMPTRLRPSCNVPGRGLAFPPRRIVQTGQALDARGARVEIVSICRDDFRVVTDAIVRATM